MAISTTNKYAQVKQVIALSLPATPDQLAALKAELDSDPDGRGYKDGQGNFLPLSQLFGKLNDSFVKDNPLPQGRVPATSISKSDLSILATTLKSKYVALKMQGQTLPDPIAYIVDELVPQAVQMDSLDLQKPGVEPAIAGLVQSGMITQDEADALTTQPDPTWKASTRLPGAAVAICGIAEVSDIVAALALEV